jgi:hypothetical protein
MEKGIKINTLHRIGVILIEFYNFDESLSLHGFIKKEEKESRTS